MRISIAMISTVRPHKLERAIDLLRIGGFMQHVTVMAEPGRRLETFMDGVTVKESPVQLGAYANWKRALTHLASQEEPYGLLVEDDVIYKPESWQSLKRLLETEVPNFASLYTSHRARPDARMLLRRMRNAEGWHRISSYGAYGCLAMCFCKRAMQNLLEHLDKIKDADPMTFPMDNEVYRYFDDAFGVWFHFPSLAQHIDPMATSIPRAVNMPSEKNERLRQAYKF